MSEKLARWAIIIQEIRPIIIYRPGRANEFADGLSRKPMTDWDKMLAEKDPVDKDEPIFVTRIKCDILPENKTKYTENLFRISRYGPRLPKIPDEFQRKFKKQVEHDYIAIRQAQDEDPRLHAMIQYFENDTVDKEFENYIKMENKHFEFYKNILWRSDKQFAELRVIVPIAERKLLIQENHDTPFAGHFGPRRTFG
ncbi:MAG: hypothetical protein GY738_17505, partial [Pseudoalteromonas sp.]|nr:hypothetical protein [Pseudoalteromonas sp.]